MPDGPGEAAGEPTVETRRAAVDSEVRRALAAVPRNLLTAGACEPLASLDAPVGCLSPTRPAPPCPSPSAAGLTLEAADLSPGDRVLVQGRGVGWLALAAAALVEGSTVRVEEEHEDLRARWRSARSFRMRDDVRLADPAGDGGPGVDRVVAWNPGPEAGRRLQRRLDGTGSVLVVRPDADDPRLTRHVRRGPDSVRLDLTELEVPWGEPAGGARTPGGLLRGEALLSSVWTGERPPGLAREVGEAVDDTIERALAERGLRRRAPERAAAARVGFHLGYTHQVLGEPGPALEAYGGSIEILPTAEAYTFRGWVRGQQGQVGKAVADCRRAIDEDPRLGNPYNDIGAYRLEQCRAEEALEWFERAIEAERYADRELAHLNAARAHLALDRPGRAREALEEALAVHPGFEPARRLMERLDRRRDDFEVPP